MLHQSLLIDILHRGRSHRRASGGYTFELRKLMIRVEATGLKVARPSFRTLN